MKYIFLSLMMCAFGFSGHAGDVTPYIASAHLDEKSTVALGIEYRNDPVWHDLRPAIGIMIDHEYALYGYAGAYYDIALSDSWTLSPSLMAGLYEDGESVNLGGAVQFRSGIELAHQFQKVKAALAFQHMSNAGIYNKNPGTELLTLYIHIPVVF